MLDSLIVVGPGGQVCYHGKPNEAISYFESLGFPCPQQTNPAEFLYLTSLILHLPPPPTPPPETDRKC